MSKLPIEGVLPELKEALRSGVNAVLIAAPGAGKTTRIPLALLEEPWLDGRRILMLEPRRDQFNGGRGGGCHRQRPDACPPVFAAYRDDEAGDGPGHPVICRTAERKSRTVGTGDMLPPLDGTGGQAACPSAIPEILQTDLSQLALELAAWGVQDPAELALLEGIAAEGLDMLPWTKTARQLQQRLMFMHRIAPEWPDLS